MKTTIEHKLTMKDIDSYISADLGYSVGNGEHIVDFWDKDNTRFYAEFKGNENDLGLDFWEEKEGEQAKLIKSLDLGEWKNITAEGINSTLDFFYESL